MNDPRAPMPSNPDETQGVRRGLPEFLKLIDGLHDKWDALIKRVEPMQRGMRINTIGMALATVMMLVVGVGMSLHACSISSKANDMLVRLDEIVRVQEQLRDSSATKRQVEDVKTQVEQVADDQLKVEIRTSDAGAGRRPTAAIVVRPKAARPAVSASAGSPPVPPAIEIPVALPPGSKVSATDAGAP